MPALVSALSSELTLSSSDYSLAATGDTAAAALPFLGVASTRHGRQALDER